MAEPRRSSWAFSWLIGIILVVAAALLLLVPSVFGNGGGWETIASAELLACLSGIAFSWFVIRLMRGPQKFAEPSASPGVQVEDQKVVHKTPGTKQDAVRSSADADLPKGDEAKQKAESTSPMKLFAARAARIQARADALKEKSTKVRAAQMAMEAAKAQAAQEVETARRTSVLMQSISEKTEAAVESTTMTGERVATRQTYTADQFLAFLRDLLDEEPDLTSEDRIEAEQYLAEIKPLLPDSWSWEETAKAVSQSTRIAKETSQKARRVAIQIEDASNKLSEAIAMRLKAI